VKILILEDSEERIKRFKKILFKYELYFYQDVESAKKAVEENQFDVYFLDHDLDDRVYVDSNELNTGWQFAKFLAEKKIDAQVYVHTMNPTGAQNILNVLPNAILIPFCYLPYADINLEG
jgi:CheY-like chemotaxis protein